VTDEPADRSARQAFRLELALRLLAGAVGLVAVFSVAGRILGNHSRGAEAALIARVAGARTSTGIDVARTLTQFGSITVLGPVVAVVAASLLVRRRLASGFGLAVATLGAVLLVNVVKVIVGRPRPSAAHLVSVNGHSFPSGHATQSAAILLALALTLLPAGRARVVGCVAAAIAAVLIGCSRTYLGVHYPSDVVAGWMLGTSWTVLTMRLFADVRGKPSAPSAAPRR
jgi:undecaprenyl-diphosphatase